jgi:hypothetical protein
MSIKRYLTMTITKFIDSCRDEPNGVVNDLFSFDWKNEFSTEKNLKLKNGTKAHFIVNNHQY